MPEVWCENNRFYRSFSYRFGDCSSDKTASIYSIMKLFSEMAGEDYESRGLGFTTLCNHGQAFLLSRMALRFKRMPILGETIVASTWERLTKGVFFVRDFNIHSKTGEELVTATSQWIIVDPATREILRPEMVYGGVQQRDPSAADEIDCRKIRMNAYLPVLGERPIWHSDIDANGHVNNAVYGKIADDFLPDEYRNDVKELYIEFKSETKLGETMQIKGERTDNGFIVQGVTDSVYHFGAEFVF